MVSGVAVIFFHALSGLTTVKVLRFFLVSLPLLFLGTYTGSFFYGKIKEEDYKRVMLILLAFLGGFMIYRAI